ncbi:MAG: DDE-type integrase/transposase/recombinase [Eubacterium sp.]|nr:DDE-type integrase/transposase/recombinase [Eubacterium sp.]MCM1418587.1 DDE-type integrase/transposase/recombinase [Roseburia sp.]
MRDLTAERYCEKCVTGITVVLAKNVKLYVSAIFDCYDLFVEGISPADHMRAELCVQTVESACQSFGEMRGAILHSDRGSRCTSEKFRRSIAGFGIVQSMNSAGGKCHDNVRCESMWARMKEELFYLRGRKPENFTVDELKTLNSNFLRKLCQGILTK